MHRAPDPCRLHRIALRPLLPDAPSDSLANAYREITEIGESRFAEFLQFQGLGPQWHRLLEDNDALSLLDPGFCKALHEQRVTAAASYLVQSRGMREVGEILDTAGIPYAIIKGAHVREVVYPDPSVRGAMDIDVLVSPQDRAAAIGSLVEEGFEFEPKLDNISHEADLTKNLLTIDLHWDILRPGRTRIPLTDVLLASRQDYSTHWGLCTEGSLYLMLVHPVFAKYATALNSALARMLDLAWWVRRGDIDWGKLHDWLARTGLCTAAWITLEWLHQLTDHRLPAQFHQRIAPSQLRTAHLRHWIRKDLSSRYLAVPLLVQAALTLPAHDRIRDAARATASLIRAKRRARHTLAALRNLTSGRPPAATAK